MIRIHSCISHLFSPPVRRGGLPGGGRGINRADSWSGTSVGLMGLGILLLLDTGPEEKDRESGSSTCQSDPRGPVGKVNLSRSSAEGKCSHDSDRDGESGAGKPLRVGESGSRTGMRLGSGWEFTRLMPELHQHCVQSSHPGWGLKKAHRQDSPSRSPHPCQRPWQR